MSRHRLMTSMWGSLTALMLVALTTVFAQAAGSTQEGWLSVMWADGQPGSGFYTEVYVLSLDSGENIYLDINEEVLAAGGGLAALNAQRVQVTTANLDLRGNTGKATVSAISLAPLPMSAIPQGAGQREVTGSQPWVTILCAFPGTPVGAGTATLDYFQDMYDAAYPGMDHYWREQSFNKVNLLGSESYGWFTLPHSQTHYYPNPSQGSDPARLDALRADCIAAADATVNFAPFVGVNMMFNGDLDCCAWGGGDFLTIDGVTKLWRLTWNPPWSWANLAVVSHEIGHGFGLPHANNSDGDNNPYDTPWDVMSDTWSTCGFSTHPDYGCLGQHTNAGYKDYLGWFNNARRLQVTGSTGEINLDNAAMPNADDYQILIIPINKAGTKYYAVEARQRTNTGYDVKVPGKAVVIWEMNLNRSEWAWQVGAISDATSSSVSNGPDGAWLPGESFVDDELTISVISETTDGFVVEVTIDNSQLISNGGMEDYNSNKVPSGWTPKTLSSDKVKCNKTGKTFSYSGSCAFMFKGSVGEKSAIGQNPSIREFNTGDSLNLSLYLNANKATVNGKVKVIVVYTDSGLAKDKIVVPFTQTDGYTEFNGDVTLKSGNVNKIKFNIQNKSSAGKVFVDDVSLQWSTSTPPSLLAVPGSN